MFSFISFICALLQCSVWETTLTVNAAGQPLMARFTGNQFKFILKDTRFVSYDVIVSKIIMNNCYEEYM